MDFVGSLRRQALLYVGADLSAVNGRVRGIVEDNQPAFNRHANQLGLIVGIQFLHQVGAVAHCRVRADGKGLGIFVVRPSAISCSTSRSREVRARPGAFGACVVRRGTVHDGLSDSGAVPFRRRRRCGKFIFH